MGLLAEISGVDEEQDALCPTKLEQAIDRGDGGESLSRTGGHVYEGEGLILGERVFESGDGADLAIAQVSCRQRGHLLGQATTQRLWLV